MTDFGTNQHIDDSVWHSTHYIRQGVLLALDSNEFSECIQGVVPVTNSAASYEKSLSIKEIVTQDPSGDGIDRDACADDSRGRIAAGNMSGRAWGRYSDVVIEPGADGLGIGKETGCENHGSDQPLLDTATSKYAHLVTAKGKAPATAAFYATAGKYHHGMVMRSDSLTEGGTFTTLYQAGTNTPLFSVNAKGELTVAGRKVVVKEINGQDCLTLE